MRNAKLIDAAIALLSALAVCVSIGASDEAGSTEPDLLAYVLGVAIAAPLLVRRRHPAGALIASACVLLAYYMLDYPAIGVAVPLAAATYTAVAAGHRWTAIAVTGLLELSAIVYRALAESESAVSVIGIGTVADLSLLAAIVLLADAVESRRALHANARRERDRRVEQERLRIARELHDILGHTIAVINVHAGVATESVGDDPDQARASLLAIRDQSREATGQLKAALGLLRDGSETPLGPLPGLADLEDLAVEGLDLEIAISGERRSVPSEVELTAYRVAQESVTNVVRHANAASVTIDLAYEPEALLVTVSDDGRGPGSRGSGGYGIAGMRERVQAIGGSLEAGAVEGNGFRVRARLPT